MSQLVSRILLAILMFPAAFLVYVGIAVPLGTRGGGPDLLVFLSASTVTGIFIVGWWVLLWRRSVRWTRGRVALTAFAVPIVLGPGLVIGAWAEDLVGEGFGAFLGGVTAIFSWLIATVFIWRETAEERAARIRAGGPQTIVCPRCGYNLTGLRQTACPECGGTWTVDELLATQPARQDPEL
jgi:hypothetical protein